MKKAFQRTVSCLLIAIMLVFSAPIGRFADIDWSTISSIFDFKAEAAEQVQDREFYADASEDLVIVGTLDDYVIFVNAPGKNPYISEITVGGYVFEVKEYVISIDTVRNAEGQKVIFHVKDNKVIEFYLLKSSPDVFTSIKDIESVAGDDGKIKYVNGKFSSKSFNIEASARNLFRPVGKFPKDVLQENEATKLDNISLTFELDNTDLLYFKDGFFSSNKLKKITVTIDSILDIDEIKTINQKVYVNTDYKFDSTDVSKDVDIRITMNAKLGNQTISESTSEKITFENIDYYKDNIEWESAPYSKVLNILSRRVEQCPDDVLSDDEKADLKLWFTEAFVYGSLNSLDNDVTVVELCLDGVGAIQGLKLDFAYSIGEIYLQEYIYDTRREIRNLENGANESLLRLIDSNEFQKYIAWYESDVSNRNGFSIKHSGKCPIDIVVKDDNGEIVLKIIDEAIAFCDENVTAFVVDGKKTFYLPTDINHSIEIIATDDGTMEYDITEFVLGCVERNVSFYKVPLKKGVSYGTVSKQKELIDAAEYNLISNEGNIIEYDSDSLFDLQILSDIAKALSYKHPYVDIKEYEIPVAEAADVIATAKEYFRSVYGYDIDGTFSYDVVYDSHKNTIVRFKFNYGTGLDSSAPVNTIEAQANVLNEIKAYTNGMSDFDKAIYIHDYLVLNGEYDIELSDIIENGSLTDELLSERYDKYALLVNGTGVCDTYATAYEYLLDNCGVDCVTISSTAMNHAWNMVKLNGSWYHVDCTWDDPVKDRIGLSRYDFFLVNDSEMREKDHYSWWTSYTSTSTTYSAIPRDDSNRVAYGEGHWCYYEDGSLYYSDVCGGNSKLITNLSFDAVDIYGNYIYGVSGKSLYKISVSDPDAGAVLIYALQETPKSIYIDKNGILEYYTYTAKSFETVDVDNCLAVESITVNGDKNVSRNGEKIQLGVIAHTSDYDFNPAVDSIIWTSSDEAVATVSETGLVTPDIAGSAVITATLGNFSDDYTITVEKWKDSNEGIINSGLSWKLDIDSKTLNIIGSGAIADYSNASDAPWYEYRNYIENLNIVDTVTKIGKNAFVGFSKTKELTVPVSVTEIAEGAFAGWSAVEKLVLPFVGSSRTAKNTYDAVLGYIFGRSNNGVMQYYVSDGSTMHGYNYAIPTGIKEIIITDAAHISFGAFYNCSALEYLEINNGVTEIGDKMLAECSSVIGLKVPFIGSTASAEATFDAVVGYFFGTTDSSGKIQYMQFEYYPDTGRLSYGGYYYNIPASFKKIEVTNDADIPTGAFTNIAFDEIILGSATNEIKDYAFYLSNTVDKLIVYNRSCVFNDRFGLNSFTGTVYGYTGSTAETFANNKINMDFVPLDESTCSHRFGQWIVIQPATCTNIGREYRMCETCPYTETRTVATIDHNFSSTWTVDVQATCTDTGSSSRHCLNCSAVTDVISTPVLDHEFSDTWTVDNAATCTVDGLKSRHCINCDAVTDETVIEAPGHRYGSWKTITAATCETRGLKKKTCSVCGYEASRNIAVLGHNYSADWTVDVEATCFETGSQSRHCTRCTSTVDVIEIPVLEHEIEDGFCNNCGSDFRDPIEKCSCNCHKGGFAGFIFKFILFFQRLFGANKECDCGIEHY